MLILQPVLPAGGLLSRLTGGGDSPRKVWNRLSGSGRLASATPGPVRLDRFQRQAHTAQESGQGAQHEGRGKSPPLKVVRPLRKLMSYNAENFYQTSHGKMMKSPRQIQALADVIEKEAPDVIALQEVGNRAFLAEFNKKYLHGAYPNIVSHRVAQSGPIQVALMSRKGVDIADSRSHWKEVCSDTQGAGKRDFLEATFKTDTGYRFTVFNAHLKSMRGDEAKTAPVRLSEAGAAAKILKKFLASNPKAHVLVTGDFNTLHQTALGKPVIDTMLYLGQLSKDPKAKPIFTEVGLKDGKADPTQSSRGRYPDAKLDYTFASPDLLPLIQDTYVAGKFDQAPWNQASDHLPLMTVFEEGKPQALPAPDKLAGGASKADDLAKKRKLELIA